MDKFALFIFVVLLIVQFAFAAEDTGNGGGTKTDGNLVKA